MNENPSASEWAGERGEKWCAQFAGMEAMLAPVDEPLIRALHLDQRCRIADIGCGAGGMALEILHRAPAGSVVRGFDISPALIEVARSRKPSEEGTIDFEIADMATAVTEARYDRLVSRFGIMFFDDAPAAFANLARWLMPGGRFAFAAWGPLAENPWMTTIRDAVAEVVDVPKPDPEAPGPFRYAMADKLLALLGQAGFGNLEVRDWRGQLSVGGGLSAADASNFALGSSSYSEMLAEAGDHALHQARQSLISRFSRHEQDGIVRMDASVHIFTGARPG